MKQVLIALSLYLFSYVCIAQTAADFSLKTSTGEQISLADFTGQATVIHFWATWCPYCKKLQPELNRVAAEYKDKQVNFIAISIWEDEGADPQAVINERGHKFQTLVNGDKIAELYGVKGTPTTVFIDAGGNIVGVSTQSDPKLPFWEKAFEALSKNN